MYEVMNNFHVYALVPYSYLICYANRRFYEFNPFMNNGRNVLMLIKMQIRKVRR